jgi:hypothetical protein
MNNKKCPVIIFHEMTGEWPSPISPMYEICKKCEKNGSCMLENKTYVGVTHDGVEICEVVATNANEAILKAQNSVVGGAVAFVRSKE